MRPHSTTAAYRPASLPALAPFRTKFQSLSKFAYKTEAELAHLSEEDVLAYIVAARDAGHEEHARQTAAVLVWRYERIVKSRVRAKTPPAAHDDVVMDVMEGAIRSAFDGKFIGQFRSWIDTITRNKIVDFHRRAERSPELTGLGHEHEGEEGAWVWVANEDEANNLLPYRELAERLCRERNEIHATVIRIYGPIGLGFLEFDAASTCTEVNRLFPDADMKEPNVHQIWRRFRAELEEQLRPTTPAG